MSRSRRWSFALPLLLVLTAACGDPPAGELPHATGHLFSDELSGIALDLPTVWAGRYQMSDSITAPEPGLERELTLRFVRADSGVVATPLVVIRVFEATAWNALSPDGTARFGARVADNASHAVALAMAAENPLAANSADALAFDTLMIALNQRPLRAWLRPGPR